MRLLDLKSKVFIDQRNRNIYYNVRQKTAYVIPDRNMSAFNFFHKRGFISVLLTAGLSMFTNIPVYINVAVGLALFVVLEILLKKVVLPSYTTIKNYDLRKNRPPLKPNDPRNGRLIGVMLAAIVFIIASLFFPLEQYQKLFFVAIGVYMFIDALYSLMDNTQPEEVDTKNN